MTRRALLLHGLSSSPEGWWRVAGWLADDGWQTETPALLGHGGRGAAPSYALAAYADDIRRTAPGPWDLVIGHSLGGAIATVLAAADPEWTARLVLLDPVWHVPADELESVAADQIGELAITAQSVAEQKPHWDARDRAAKVAAITVVQREAVGRTFADAGEWDIRDAVRSLAVPTLVLTGDPAVYTMTPADDAAGASVELRPVAGAGHSPHRDEPDRTRELLAEWLSR